MQQLKHIIAHNYNILNFIIIQYTYYYTETAQLIRDKFTFLYSRLRLGHCTE